MKADRRKFIVQGTEMLFLGTAAMAMFQSEPSAQTPPSKTDVATPLPAGATSKFAKVNGIQMHYVTMGSGPVVLLLHGWPQTWFAWHDIMPRLAGRFTVVAPDLRGNGLSELTPSGYDKRTIAEDLRSLIAHLNVAKAHVVGHDMGGKAAYVLAHLNPESVSTLTLVDCLVPGTENLDALRGGAWHYGFHMAPTMPEMLTKGREREYISAQIKAWSRKKTAISEDSISEFAHHYSGEGRMTAGFNYYRALRDDAPFVAPLRGRKLAMPVLTIAGRYSAGDKLAESLKAEASNLTSFIAEDSGHFVAEESPDFFIAKLEQFLKE